MVGIHYNSDLCSTAMCMECCGCEQYNKALEDLKSKVNDEYYDGGYGDYHEVEMIVRIIDEMLKK